MPRALIIACLAFVVTGCTTAGSRNYVTVFNGGLGARTPACTQAGFLIDKTTVRMYARTAPGCSSAAVADSPSRALRPKATAAFAYWQVPTAPTVTGPVLSNRVRLRLIGLSESGGGRLGLVSSGGSVGVATGGGHSSVRTGGGRAASSSGGGRSSVTSGGGARSLTSGGGHQPLRSGGGRKIVVAGSGSESLTAGGGSRRLVGAGRVDKVIALLKTVSQSAVDVGFTAAFSLTVKNLSTSSFKRLVLVDRVDHRLQVVDAGRARIHRLPDKTTVLIWDDHRTFAPGALRTYRIVFRVPGM